MYGDKYVDEMINEGLRVDDNQQKPAACLNNMTELKKKKKILIRFTNWKTSFFCKI